METGSSSISILQVMVEGMVQAPLLQIGKLLLPYLRPRFRHRSSGINLISASVL